MSRANSRALITILSHPRASTFAFSHTDDATGELIYFALRSRSAAAPPTAPPSAAANTTGPCGCEAVGGTFCNYDYGDSGFCEPCSSRNTPTDCHSDGLPAAGAADCERWCFPSTLEGEPADREVASGETDGTGEAGNCPLDAIRWEYRRLRGPIYTPAGVAWDGLDGFELGAVQWQPAIVACTKLTEGDGFDWQRFWALAFLGFLAFVAVFHGIRIGRKRAQVWRAPSNSLDV